MKRDLSLWQLSGFALTSLAGTLLHFLYDWTGENKIAALISGVNESTWEHMKLLYFPLLVYAIIEYLGTKDATSMRRTLKDSFRKVRALRARELREVLASLFFLARFLLYPYIRL